MRRWWEHRRQARGGQGGNICQMPKKVSEAWEVLENMNSLSSFLPKPISIPIWKKQNKTHNCWAWTQVGILCYTEQRHESRPWSWSHGNSETGWDMQLLVKRNSFPGGSRLWIGMFSYPQTHNHDHLAWLKPQIILLDFIQTSNFSPPLPAFSLIHTERHLQLNIVYSSCLETKIAKFLFSSLFIDYSWSWNMQKQKTAFIIIYPLCEVSQKEKNKYHMLTHIYGI